jgi:hypothetical protein
MRINWVLSDNLILDPLIEIDRLKNIGSFWGGWKTWRSNQTDSVVCHDQHKAVELLKRNFHLGCNLYVPQHAYQFLGRPQQVQLYDGDFKQEIKQPDEIVTMHLVSSISDIVLMLGFDLEEKPKNPDRLIEHHHQNYHFLVNQIISDNPTVQWVLIDHPGAIAKRFEHLSNLTKDTLSNVLDLLG